MVNIMERKYSKELLNKLAERQETIKIKGVKSTFIDEVYAKIFNEDGYVTKRN